jgi:predicted enzyme related to lactoylglutathione lyase
MPTPQEDPTMENVMVWADIPVTDMQRAIAFYAHVTGEPVMVMPGSGDSVAVVGRPEPGQAAVVSVDLYLGGTPSHDGPTIYLGSGGDIDAAAARVEEAGGTILQAKKFMGPMVGWIVFFEDTEGNRIGIQQSAK